MGFLTALDIGDLRLALTGAAVSGRDSYELTVGINVDSKI